MSHLSSIIDRTLSFASRSTTRQLGILFSSGCSVGSRIEPKAVLNPAYRRRNAGEVEALLTVYKPRLTKTKPVHSCRELLLRDHRVFWHVSVSPPSRFAMLNILPCMHRGSYSKLGQRKFYDRRDISFPCVICFPCVSSRK